MLEPTGMAHLAVRFDRRMVEPARVRQGVALDSPAPLRSDREDRNGRQDAGGRWGPALKRESAEFQ